MDIVIEILTYLLCTCMFIMALGFALFVGAIGVSNFNDGDRMFGSVLLFFSFALFIVAALLALMLVSGGGVYGA